MNREEFEEYCWEHGWKIECIKEYIIVSKDDNMFKERFQVGMMLRDLVHKMKEADYGTDDEQGIFPLSISDELPM